MNDSNVMELLARDSEDALRELRAEAIENARQFFTLEAAFAEAYREQYGCYPEEALAARPADDELRIAVEQSSEGIARVQADLESLNPGFPKFVFYEVESRKN